MRDEEIDNMDELIREASKSHHPAYDDKAWEKMEALLNEHLPVKEDRRRPVIFFLLLLFIISAGVFAVYQTGGKKKGIAEKTGRSNVPAQFSDTNTWSPGNHFITKDPKAPPLTTPLSLKNNRDRIKKD